ncbi:MAG: (2Fe-2S)-binding protein [Rhodanobacter sp.]|jgi:isoquinoline 1-oxidoreductase alpha subunit|nr:(2Fe-2S)-binding protein [Rhodanobacter sp.]
MPTPPEHRTESASAESVPTESAKHTSARPPASLPITINGKPYFHDGDPQMPLLWFLRDVLRLTGTKFGCGVGACGACTVLIDGKAARSCTTPMQTAAEHKITTIEGLETTALHPVQQAWIEEDVAQCGYCQAGQIMATVDLLHRKPKPSEEDIATLSNLCRCGTYPRIRRAVQRAAELLRNQDK